MKNISRISYFFVVFWDILDVQDPHSKSLTLIVIPGMNKYLILIKPEFYFMDRTASEKISLSKLGSKLQVSKPGLT